MLNNSSALFWKASAILSSPNWKDLVIIKFKISFFNSKSTSNETSVKFFFPLNRYYTPQEFKELGAIAKAKGFLLVSSSPLTRSSYHADEDFAKLQQNRIKDL